LRGDLEAILFIMLFLSFPH